MSIVFWLFLVRLLHLTFIGFLCTPGVIVFFFFFLIGRSDTLFLESTNADPASNAARRGTRCPTQLPARRSASAFFFFLEFTPTRLESHRCGSICAESASIRAESG